MEDLGEIELAQVEDRWIIHNAVEVGTIHAETLYRSAIAAWLDSTSAVQYPNKTSGW
jgi:hypothetical protein